jgi:hypothetical protein
VIFEQGLDDRPGGRRLSIVGSRANENWEMKVERPKGFVRSHTLVRTAGGIVLWPSHGDRKRSVLEFFPIEVVALEDYAYTELRRSVQVPCAWIGRIYRLHLAAPSPSQVVVMQSLRHYGGNL